jgi:hypothetical protein
MGRMNVFAVALVLGMATAALVGCGPAGAPTASDSAGNGGTISNPGTEVYKPVPLMWEGQNRDGVLWSAFVYSIIGSEVAPALLPGSDDIADFCPAYPGLKDAQKVNLWAFIISAIVKYESGFNPAAAAPQPRMDAVTGKQASNDGLMQLAYDDMKKYAFCVFDANGDGKLDSSDKKRTIFDPLKNLDCGIKIFATQVEDLKKIVSSTARWASLRPSGGKSHVHDIQNATRALPFCKTK